MNTVFDKIQTFGEAPVAGIVRWQPKPSINVLGLKLEKHLTSGAQNGYRKLVGRMRVITDHTLVWSLPDVSLTARPRGEHIKLESTALSRHGELEIWEARVFMKARASADTTADAYVELLSGKIFTTAEMPDQTERKFPTIVSEWKLVRPSSADEKSECLATWSTEHL